MPTPFSIASSTTPTGLISPATACDAPAPPRLPRIDHPSHQMQKIIRQRGTGPRATSCRNTGRHHLGMPGRLRRNPHFSGGNTERPALQRLLEDVRAGRIDVIVVYKVDRLTRSLADFAKLVELFDRHHVSFVSVTQP